MAGESRLTRVISAASARARGAVVRPGIPVFGRLLKRGGKVYAVIIPNAGAFYPSLKARFKPRQQHRQLQGLRRTRCLGLPPRPHQSLPALRRGPQPHQRHRELLATRRNVISGATTASQSITSTSISRSANGAQLPPNRQPLEGCYGNGQVCDYFELSCVSPYKIIGKPWTRWLAYLYTNGGNLSTFVGPLSRPMDMIVSGWFMSLFQAWHPASGWRRNLRRRGSRASFVGGIARCSRPGLARAIARAAG